jgi:hypothetical protein
MKTEHLILLLCLTISSPSLEAGDRVPDGPFQEDTLDYHWDFSGRSAIVRDNCSDAHRSEAKVMPVIRRTINPYVRKYDVSYRRRATSLRTNNLTGSLVLRFRINRAGTVDTTYVVESSVTDDSALARILGAFGKCEFDSLGPAQDGCLTEVTYAIDLDNSSDYQEIRNREEGANQVLGVLRVMIIVIPTIVTVLVLLQRMNH